MTHLYDSLAAIAKTRGQEKSLYDIHRGDAYYALKEYKRAIEDYTRAIKLDPKQAWVYGRRGNAYSELKKYERAIKDYTRAIKLDSGIAWFYKDRGNAYSELKEYERAIENYDRAIELDPHQGFSQMARKAHVE